MERSENYLGNPNLKRTNVPIEYEQEQVEEYIRCADNCEYFVDTYMKIVSVDLGLIPFEMWPFQRLMLRSYVNDRFVINKLPRQSGKSTTVTAYMLWLILFHDNQNIAILANKGMLARDLLGKITLAYEYLPKWLQQGIITWNRGNIELENGSKIVAASTSSSAIRGGSYNLIFLDEFAFVGNNMATEFFGSVYPTISSGSTSKVIIVSTPNGMNHFYKLWVDAEEGRNEYVPFQVHWSQIPGRDGEWKKQTISNTSEEQFAQEFECEFLGSINTLISASKLKSLTFLPPIKRYGTTLDVYKEPEENHVYAIAVDVSRGVGLDYSAFIVFDISTTPYTIAAKYRCRDISPLVYPNAIANTGRMYNEAFVLVELNDMGEQVANILHYDLEYANILTSTVRGRGGQTIGGGFAKNIQFGVKTTKTVKGVGCSNLRDLIETDKLIVQDFDLIAELASFQQKGSSYEAEEGSHDDLVMCCVIFAWLVRQSYFKEITDTDIREKIFKEKMKLLEDDILPFGIIEDGSDDTFVDNTGQLWHNRDYWLHKEDDNASQW
jgi:hypothetical protein